MISLEFSHLPYQRFNVSYRISWSVNNITDSANLTIPVCPEQELKNRELAVTDLIDYRRCYQLLENPLLVIKFK